MKQSLLKSTGILLALAFFVPAQERQLVLQFFGSGHCSDCSYIKETILRPYNDRYPARLRIDFYDTDDSGSFCHALEMERKFNVSNPSAQELFFPDTFLNGYAVIVKNAPALIERYLAEPYRWADRETVSKDKTAQPLRVRIKVFLKRIKNKLRSIF
jgi:hypothetical protein